MEPAKILVVDDDPLTRDLLTEILRDENRQVESAENGRLALDALEKNSFDLVVSDLHMPEMGGLELIKALRVEKGSDIPVIVLSANDEVRVALDAIQSGATDYLIKDENIQETVFLAVDKALEKARLQKQNRDLKNDVTKKDMEMEGALGAMTEISIAISSEKDFQNLLRSIIIHSRTLTNADAGTLYLKEGDRLAFQIFQNDTLGVDLGSRTGKEISSPPVEICESNVSGFAAIKRTMVNVPDVYHSDLFDFGGPKRYDELNGYRSVSMLVAPMINRYNEVVGVIQLINAKDPATRAVVSFSAFDEKLIKSVASLAAIAVTNLKFKEKSEQLLNEVLDVKNYNENVLQSLTNGVFALDKEKRITLCNAAALRILNVKSEDLVQRSAEECFAENNGWLLVYIQTAMETGEPIELMDAELKLDGDAVVPVNLTVAPVTNLQKEMIGSLVVFEDVTQEKRIKGTLSRYMTEEVAEKLLESGGDVLGGQIQEASILFSDIRGFTSFTETLGANETVVLLNEYLSAMIDVVFMNHGILDKFIGDAILAVFGAPFQTGDDPDNAVTAAVDMMIALREFNLKRRAENKMPIDIGVGVNTDEVLSGNIGSEKRMEYTCIGDGVNLASRLEGVNKLFGTNILITENTRAKLKRDFHTREMDFIRVKGKENPIAIYEVLDFFDDAAFPNRSECVELFNEGIKSYRGQNWDPAEKYFSEVLRHRPQDAASQVYLDRRRHFKANPPGDDWDGVWTMESK